MPIPAGVVHRVVEAALRAEVDESAHLGRPADAKGGEHARLIGRQDVGMAICKGIAAEDLGHARARDGSLHRRPAGQRCGSMHRRSGHLRRGLLGEAFERARDLLDSVDADVQISQRRRDADVPEERLNRDDVDAVLEQVRGESMA